MDNSNGKNDGLIQEENAVIISEENNEAVSEENNDIIPEENDIEVSSKKRPCRWTKEKTIIAALAFLVVAVVVFNALFLSGVIKLRKDNIPAAAVADMTTWDNTDTQVSETDTSKPTEPTVEETTEKESETEQETTTETAEAVTVKPSEQTQPEAVPEPDTTQAVVNTNASYVAEFTVINSWEENGRKCYQLSGTVTNKSSVGIKSWTVSKDAGTDIEIKSFWNCTCTVSGSKIVIEPVDYNTEIAAGASVSDIGLIVSSTGTLTAFSYSGNTTNVASGSTGGSTQGSQSSSSPSGGSTSSQVTPYTPPKLESGTPVGNHGQLSVSGTDLVDRNGAKYQLKGVSTHGLQWFPQYVSKDAFKTLRDEWGANVIRLAMYTGEGGYCSGADKSSMETLVSQGVEACTELGMYVIIDWHILSDGNPNTYKSDAIAFFDKMSKTYSKNVNVIYEICNEPNGNVDWNTIKQYADEVIPVIRNNAPNAIILVGTPTWSQEVDKVAANPVANPKNVMYTLHFYAATHKDDLRNRLKTALAAGTPVFISEFSICDASGNGGIDYDSAKAWKDLINSYNISYAGWNLSNKSETSSLIASGCSKTSGWSTDDLSETGKWLRDFIAGK